MEFRNSPFSTVRFNPYEVGKSVVVHDMIAEQDHKTQMMLRHTNRKGEPLTEAQKHEKNLMSRRKKQCINKCKQMLEIMPELEGPINDLMEKVRALPRQKPVRRKPVDE